MKYNRHFGQNLMRSYYFIERILNISDIKHEDTILEIGAGEGDLREGLCERASKVISYEVDERLFLLAKKKLSKYKNLVLLNENGFKSTFRFNKIVSNLPYSQSRKFVFWLTEKEFESATVVLQKEFVEKLTSQPGVKSYRAISVISQLSFKMSTFDQIPPDAFFPTPKVYSYIVKFEALKPSLLDYRSKSLLRLCFSFKRKKICNIIKYFSKDVSSLPDEIKSLKEKRIDHLSPKDCLTLLGFLSSFEVQ